MSGNSSIFTDNTRYNQEDHRIRRYNRILEGINRIFGNVVQAKTEEELGSDCLSVALEVTGSQIGFVGKVGADGLSHDIAISDMGWSQCLMYDKTGHRRPPGDFILHGLYGHVIDSGKGFFTNDPQSHPDSIGLPPGHPSISSFLGVPLVQDGETVGILAVANREDGYSFEQQEDLEAIALAVTQALKRKWEEQERKNAEEALRMSEERFRIALQDSPVVVFSQDLELRYTWVFNPSPGFKVEDVLGKRDYDIYQPEDAGTFVAIKRQVLSSGVSRRDEVVTHRPISAGGDLVHEMTTEPMRDATGTIVGVICAATNITERKKKEEALKRSEMALARAQSIARIGNWEWNIQTGEVNWSAGLYDIYGLDPDTFKPTISSFANYVHPDDREFVDQKINEIVSNGGSSDFDFRIVLADGSIRYVNTVGEIAEYDENGKPLSMIGINQVITERKQAEDVIKINAINLSRAERLASLGHWDWDLTTNHVKWSDGHFSIFGYTVAHGTETYEMWRARVHPEDIEGIERMLWEGMEKDTGYNWNYRLLLPDGSIRYVHAEADRPVKDASGKLVRWFGTVQDITEQKLAEETLAESEQSYREIVETTDEGVATHEPDGTITYVNQRMADMLGYSREEIIGRSSLDFVDEEERERVTKARESLKEQGSFSKERKMRRKDGSILWTLANVTPRLDGAGNFLGYLAMHADITERNQAEEAIRLSEQKFAMAFANNPAAIALTRLEDGLFLDVNDTWVTLNGYSRDEAIGNFARTMHIWPTAEAAARFVQELQEKGCLHGWEQEFYNKSGEVFIAQLSAQILTIRGEKMILSTLVDITKQKRAEEALKKAHNTLEEKVKERTAELEEAYNSLLENEIRLNEAQKIAHLGNWDWNPVTDEVYWSNEMYRIFGVDPLELGATYNAFLSYVHPDDQDYVDNAFKDALSGKPFDIQHRIILANGEERIVHKQGEAIFNEENIPVRLRGTVQDVTERKKAEEKIQRLANIVESSNDAIITSTLYGIITSWNKGAEQIYGYSAEEILGKHLSILEPSILVEESKELTELIEQGDRIHHHETFHLRKDSKIINVSLTLSPVFDSSGKMTDVSFISRDITESKSSEERYRTVTEQTGQVVYEYDLRTDKSIWAGAIEEVTGYSFEEFQNLGKDFWIKNIIHTDMNCVDGNFQDQEKTGYRFNEELRLRKKDGTCNHIDSRGIFLLDHAGQPYKAIGVLKDITKRKEAEEALADIEISRKKEIHHRIKNNLQVISSLLDLQAEKFKGRKDIKDSEVLEGFRESQNRVISMALIHEELYRGGEIDTLDFSSYIKELADNLFLTYRLGNNDISLKMSLEENIFYDMDTAVPLGIIINELVSNSLKHAFAGRDKGEIQIKLSRDKNGESKNEDCMHTNFILSVSDNGVGIPEDLDIEDLDTLGMQLVTTLVDQLDGELELKRNNGTEFTIRFTVAVGLSHRKLEAQESRI
jgi:PAS domain S-box-containing protein